MDRQSCSLCFTHFYKVEKLAVYCILFTSHYSMRLFTSVDKLVWYCHINCAFPLLVSDFSASTLERVIIYVYNFLFTDTVSRNWGATDNKLQTVTSYKTLKPAVNSSVTLSPVLYYLDTFIWRVVNLNSPYPPKKARGDARRKKITDGGTKTWPVNQMNMMFQ